MPISFTEVSSIGDVLPNNRAVLFFPNLPNAMEGRDLILRHTSVSMPPMQVGQIIVKQLGWSLSFAGIRTQQNTFSVEFVETTGAPVVKTLARWQDMCSGFKTHLAKLKEDYAVNCKCVAYDTVGETALVTYLYNVWPMTVNYGQYSEDSGPSTVSVEFSVDAIDIDEVITNEQDVEFSSTASSLSLWYPNSTAGTTGSQSALNEGAFRVNQNVVNQLGLNRSNISTVLGGYF